MSPRPLDLRRVKQGLARLQALVDAYPELREPDAQARLLNWLEKEERTMTSQKGRLKGDEKARARVQRLRQRRKEQGWQPFELWLPPDSAARLAQLKEPGEALHETVARALVALQAQGADDVTSNVTSSFSTDTPSSEQRKAALMQRMRAMQAAGLSLQAIANQLNAEGEPTLSHRGMWKKGTVGNLLKE
jgi:recombinase